MGETPAEEAEFSDGIERRSRVEMALARTLGAFPFPSGAEGEPWQRLRAGEPWQGLRVGWKDLDCKYYHVAKVTGRKFINLENIKGAA